MVCLLIYIAYTVQYLTIRPELVTGARMESFFDPVLMALRLTGATGMRPEGPKPPVLVIIETSAQLTKVSWFPQPTAPVPLEHIPHVFSDC